jgi:hypothetical protein
MRKTSDEIARAERHSAWQRAYETNRRHNLIVILYWCAGFLALTALLIGAMQP